MSRLLVPYWCRPLLWCFPTESKFGWPSCRIVQHCTDINNACNYSRLIEKLGWVHICANCMRLMCISHKCLKRLTDIPLTLEIRNTPSCRERLVWGFVWLWAQDLVGGTGAKLGVVDSAGVDFFLTDMEGADFTVWGRWVILPAVASLIMVSRRHVASSSKMYNSKIPHSDNDWWEQRGVLSALPVFQKGYYLYVDNFYTSLPLFRHLLPP